MGGAASILVAADIINTTFINNYTVTGLNNQDQGGSMIDSRGGALAIYDETVRIINSTFDGNYVDAEHAYFPEDIQGCLLYTSPSPRDQRGSAIAAAA